MTVDLLEKECEARLIEQDRLFGDRLVTKIGVVASVAIPGVLVFLDLATWRGDLGFWDRIHLIFEWMLPGAGAAWLITYLRIRSRAKTPNYARYFCVAMAVAGAAIGHLAYSGWMPKPYTHRPFTHFEGWQFGVAWLLLWQAYIWRR